MKLKTRLTVMLMALGMLCAGCTSATEFCVAYTPIPTVPLEVDGSLEVDMNNAVYEGLCK